MDARGVMAGYLRAVDWFAREEPGGVGVGRVVVERGRGEAIERAIWLGDEGVEDGMFGGVYR